MDGEITIGTKLSTDKFDRQITDLEKKMQKEENKKIKIKAEVAGIKEQVNEFNELIAKRDEYAKRLSKLQSMQNEFSKKDGVTISPQLLQQIREISSEYSNMNTYIEKNANAMFKLADRGNELLRKQKEINTEISEYKQKIENVKTQKQLADVEKLKNSFNSVGSSIQSTVKHVAKLALGIFGIRSAFMFLKRASSDLASYDQQYAANLEYIRYALTQMIAPVLQWIVRLAATLLGYINAIVQAWFGINLFSRGSAKNFQKMKAGAGGVAKAAKEIKKQLAGFDEMNVLNDESSSGRRWSAVQVAEYYQTLI